MPRPATDKRERILAAAADRIHADGFHRSSLADIARQASVPVGSVYYFFKSKEELGRAVVDGQLGAYDALCEQWDALPDPTARLIAFVHMTHAQREVLAERGSPVGTLCDELRKTDSPLGDHASQVFHGLLGWLAGQFEALGRPDGQGDAAHLLAAVEGATLLTHTFRDPTFVQREAERLTAWLEGLTPQEIR